MIVLVCVDDQLGMLFNGRRQSRDRLLREHILQLTAGSCLWMNEYSAGQFELPLAAQIRVDENFMEQAAPGDYCLVETLDILPFEPDIEKIILYRWNRSYPGDLFFPLPLLQQPWNLLQTRDFAGFSHEKITEEIYLK